jgi:hypothetical protein
MPSIRSVRSLVAGLLIASLTACSSFAPRDPLHIDLVGLEPLTGEGLEMRFALKLRVQNPNDRAISYNGVALQLAVNNQPLASGVSDQSGQVPRFGEALLRIPVTISAYSAVRQAWGAAGYTPGAGLPYELSGKLGGGLFGSTRFTDSGTLKWPETRSLPQ